MQLIAERIWIFTGMSPRVLALGSKIFEKNIDMVAKQHIPNQNAGYKRRRSVGAPD